MFSYRIARGRGHDAFDNQDDDDDDDDDEDDDDDDDDNEAPRHPPRRRGRPPLALKDTPVAPAAPRLVPELEPVSVAAPPHRAAHARAHQPQGNELRRKT